VSGRLDLTTPSVAAVDEQAPVTPSTAAASVATAGGALPDLSTIAERALQVSVNISSTNLVQVPVDPFFGAFFGNRVQRSQSLGSGVIVSADGYVLTNTHVIGNQSQSIRVTTSDGQERPARLVGIDEVSDLAVVKIDDTGLPTLPWGDSLRLRVAEWVLAVGNPYQLSGTVTLGIVSTVSRSAEQVGSYQDFIQTDAAINPGNSGGALINARGELVGINSAIYSETGGYQGIGLAVPSNLVRETMDALIKDGVVRRGTILGITLQPMTAQIAEQLGAPDARGVLVIRLDRRSRAAEAGVRPGDVIVSFNDTAIEGANQFLRLLGTAEIGSTATLTIIRDGRRATVRVPIDEAVPSRRR
jgi:serine protease Do